MALFIFFRGIIDFLSTLGFMQWNTVTQNFEYSNLGQLPSLSSLSSLLISHFM